MALALENNKEFNGHEIIIERPDGSRITALAHANPIHDESGKLLGAVNVLVDISERKRAEDTLKKADRAKNEFIATLAHELRNPMAPIRNAVQVLQLEETPSPKLQWALEVIDRQMQHMTRLTDDLLDLARITSNKIELRKSRTELANLVSGAVEISRPLIEEREQELNLNIPAEPVYLNGDITRLSQVISNLLNNASKYTARGGRIRLDARLQDGEAVIVVEDNGIGIPAGKLPHIFEMFAQIGKSAEDSGGGLGIGLTLVRQLVGMHGGTVEAYSDGDGKGSTFIVRLPVITGTRSEEIPELGPETQSSASTLKRRILVVDDNVDCAESLGMLLRLTGNEVRIANDGQEAVELVGTFQPDIAFLDIGMPKLNGYEAARRIRESQGKDLLLIAVSGWGQEDDRRRSKDAGFDHHLVKPIDFDALETLLAEKDGN